MKNSLKITFLSLITFVTLSSCVQDDDFAIAPFNPLLFSESFPKEKINANQTFDFPDWTNFAEAGSKLWVERDFSNDGYIQFSTLGSGNPSNIGWAITPAIDIKDYQNVYFKFKSASNFVTNPANKLEALISSDFDGTNVLAATWTVLPAAVANNSTNGYTYIPSGEISLAGYSGNIHIAFRVIGNGTTLTGLYQVDSIKVFTKN